MAKDLRYSGTNLSSVLNHQGRRKDWLASQVGVSPSAVSRWIGGSRLIDEKTARRIAEVLDVPFSLLFESPKGDDLDPIGDGKAA